VVSRSNLFIAVQVGVRVYTVDGQWDAEAGLWHVAVGVRGLATKAETLGGKGLAKHF
jgi:hypothetical protein